MTTTTTTTEVGWAGKLCRAFGDVITTSLAAAAVGRNVGRRGRGRAWWVDGYAVGGG